MELTHLEYLEEILNSKDACDHLTGYQKMVIDALTELLSYCPYERLCELAQADREVRHGRWNPEIHHTYIPVEYDQNGDPILHEYISYRCSLCSREETKEEPYCHCGARMDKEDEHGSEFD